MGKSVVILADTHVVLWLAFSPGKISRQARAAIDEARRGGKGLAIADVTLLEIATLHKKGKVRISLTLESFLTETETKFSVLPMTAPICAQAMAFPSSFPKDPADRIIGATALVHGFPLLTADNAIRNSKQLQTIW